MARDAWLGEASRELARLRNQDAGWAYRPEGESAVETTVVAALGSLATRPADEGLAIARAAADWTAGQQQADGSLGISVSIPNPGWPTAYATLLFQAVASVVPDRSYAEPRKKALAWLLNRKGLGNPRDGNVGHDTTLIGWPWVENTHSWIEPTSVAMMALAGEGEELNARFREALMLVRDRALSTGGWNYGNTVVLGTLLRPQPAPTGMALTALALVRPKNNEPLEAVEAERVDRACKYLEAALPKIRSPLSLSWGLLGLSAWDRRPAQADAWLAEAASKSAAWSDPAMEWGLLLLAAGDTTTLSYLHARPRQAAQEPPAKVGGLISREEVA